MKRYHWNEDTIDYFVSLYETDGMEHMINRILEFVKYECQLEDGETHQDLTVDLILRVHEIIEKDN